MAAHAAVFGTGGWSRMHLAALAEFPAVDRVTLVGRSPENLALRAAEFPKITQTTTDARRVWDDPSIGWVHVVLPHHCHAEISLAALEAGKDVICEKPAATRLADLEQVLATAERLGRRHLVVMNQLYNPAVQTAAQWLAAGRLGRPFLSLENAFSRHDAHYRDPLAWRTGRQEAGGGVLIDGGFHLAYRHLYLLEPWGWPRWVSGHTAQLNLDPAGSAVPAKGEDFVAITAGYASSLRIQWSHGWTLSATPERGRQSFVAGTGGTLEWTDQSEQPLALRRWQEGRVVVEPVPVPPGPSSGIDTTRAALADYLDCLVTGRETRWGSAELARHTLGLILGAYESAERGAPVELR